jgi:CotH kinase protein/Putative metal-binding motif
LQVTSAMNKGVSLVAVLVIGGCTGGSDPVVSVPAESDGCPALFEQNILPTYHVGISDDEWAKMEDEFLHREERLAAGLEEHPYHPITLQYDDGSQQIDINNALIRLKGNSSWTQTVQFDENPKMQFVLAFNEIDPKARFMGQRKVELDMPRTDRTFMRQRLALLAMRRAGITAQCANSARVEINGNYYGLYTHIERFDKEFLQRNFPGLDDGDLWSGGRIIKTNEDTFTWDRLELFWHQTFTITDLEAIADVADSVKEWSAEAVIGDADGYYNGRPNYYLYDHPTLGFIWLPADLDTVFDMDFLPANSSLTFPLCTGRTADDRKHYAMVMGSPMWLEKYIQGLEAARASYDVAAMQQRVDNWSAQIHSAAEADKHRPFTMDEHQFAVDLMRQYIADRAAYVDSWLACYRGGGGADADGDGFDFCHDCDESAPDVNPGQSEICNGWDDDCDGLVDDVADGTTCM